MKIQRLKPPNENDFATIFNEFIQRQLHLKGSMRVIERFQVTWNVSMGAPFTVDQSTVIYDKLFRFDHEGGEDLDYLKTYLINGLLAQCIESAETYFKNLLEMILDKELNFEISTMLNRRVLGTNAEIIKILEAYVNPKESNEEIKRIKPIFDMLEQVRHLVVHSDQVIKSSSLIGSNVQFNKYFELKMVKGKCRLIIDASNAEILSAEVAQFGFEFYRLLSEKHGYDLSS